MASLEERLAQMKNGGAASPSTVVPQTTNQNNGSLTDRLAAMKSSASPEPTTQTTKAEEKEKDEPNLWERIKTNLGFIGEKAASGAAEGAEGTLNFFGEVGQRMANQQAQQNLEQQAVMTTLFGDKEQGEALMQQAIDATKKAYGRDQGITDYFQFGDNYAAKVEEKYADKDISKGVQIAGDVAQGLGGMVPAAAANLIVPGSGLAVMTTGAIGNATQEARKNGADDATAMAYGLAVGTVEAATEKLLGGMGGLFGKGALDDVAKGLINANVKNGAIRGGLNTLVSAFGEGVEEFIAEYGQSLANRLTINTEDRSFGELSKDALYSALIGGIVGSIANIGDSIKAGKEMSPKEAAKTAAEQTAAEVENSLSNGVSSQPTTDTTEAENTGRDNQGAPGLEAGETTAINDDPADHSLAEQAVPASNAKVLAVVSAYISPKTNRSPLNRELSLADNSAQQLTSKTVSEILRASNDNVAQPTTNVNELGAANVDYTINKGEQVPTQSKSTVNNINLNDMQRKAVEPPTHERISEAESLHRAQLGLYTDSEGNIVDYQNSIDDLVNADHELSGVESDRLQLLLAEAGKRNDLDNVKRIAAKLQENATFAARALQATQKWIDEKPATRLAAMYQLVDKYAKEHKAKKGKTIEIPDFLAKAYLEAETDQARDEIISDMQEYVAQQTRATFGEAFTALRYVNMLGNFKTQFRNILGNTTMLATSRVKDEVAAVVEGLANVVSHGKTGRTKSMFVGRDFIKAAKADYQNVKRQIMRYGKYTNEDFKGDFVEGIEDNRKLLLPGLEQYRRLTNLAMEGGDIIFSKAAYSRSLAGYLKANGVSAEQLAVGNADPALMEKAREHAIKQAQETTFRDSNRFSDWASSALRGEKTPKGIKAVGEGLSPFRRTPANIMVRAYEYSPIGLLVNTASKVKQAKKGETTASDIIDALSKGLTGTGLMLLGYWLRDNDLLRGSGDEDEEEIDALMNRQDWSITIPGYGSYTFDWAAPASLTMFTGAVLNDLYSDEELTLADWFDAFTSLSEPFIQMSMLSGINDTLDSIKYSDNNILQMVGQLAAGYITQGVTNTMLGQAERTSEDVRMSTYTDSEGFLPEWLQRTVGKASAKMPGWDYQQTEYLNEFGETEDSGNIGQRILENFFSPGYWEPAKGGESAYDFAERVRETLGVNAFPDAYPPEDVSYGGEKYELTQEERNEYQQTRGEAAKDYMELLDGNKDFDTGSKEDKRSIISEALSFANTQAKNEALKEKGVQITQSEVDKVKEQMSPSEYIDWLIADTKADVPEGYGSTPQWQKFEIACSLPDNLAVSMIIAQGGDTGRRISAAVDGGVSVERAVEYYRATSEYNDEGKSPTKAEVSQRLTAAGFTAKERGILIRAFNLKFN